MKRRRQRPSRQRQLSFAEKNEQDDEILHRILNGDDAGEKFEELLRDNVKALELYAVRI